MIKIVVIDGQGGNIGKQLVKKIKENVPEVTIRAIGTNSIASENMLKAGANEIATGSNAVIVSSKWADIIVGPIGIVVPDALLGEVDTNMAKAISSSSAKKVLIPMNKCDINVAGSKKLNTSELIDDAIDLINDIIK